MKKGEAESLSILAVFEILLVVFFLVSSYTLVHKTVANRYPELEQELSQLSSAYGQELVGALQPADQPPQKKQDFFQP